MLTLGVSILKVTRIGLVVRSFGSLYVVINSNLNVIDVPKKKSSNIN